MDISVDYDDEEEQRGTHSMLLPEITLERISASDLEVLKKVIDATPSHKTKKRAPVANKRVAAMKPIGGTDKLISRKAKPVQNRRSVLDGKYTSGKRLTWKRGESSLGGLYERLQAETDKAVCRRLIREAMKDLRERELAANIVPG